MSEESEEVQEAQPHPALKKQPEKQADPPMEMNPGGRFRVQLTKPRSLHPDEEERPAGSVIGIVEVDAAINFRQMADYVRSGFAGIEPLD